MVHWLSTRRSLNGRKGCWGSPVNEENAQVRDGIGFHAQKSLVGRPTQLRLRGGEDQEEGGPTAQHARWCARGRESNYLCASMSTTLNAVVTQYRPPLANLRPRRIFARLPDAPKCVWWSQYDWCTCVSRSCFTRIVGIVPAPLHMSPPHGKPSYQSYQHDSRY